MRHVRLIDSFSPRSYQEAIFATAHNHNTLVVLPTGLGKTVIALLVAIHQFNTSQKKVLVLAPTKPLVEQHAQSFKKLFANPDDFSFQVLTGQIGPKQRESYYQEGDFFFSTPQLIENDLVNGRFPKELFGAVVFDECHRATGQYAYTFIAEQLLSVGARFLGLTASPGTSKDEIYALMKTLGMEQLEYRQFDDQDVASYVQDVEMERVRVAFPHKFQSILKQLRNVFERRMAILQQYADVLRGKPPHKVTKKDLLDLQQELRTAITRQEIDENGWKAISIAAGLMKLQYGMELLETQDLRAAHKYFQQILSGRDNSKAVQDLQLDQSFRDACEEIASSFRQGEKHPKLIKSRELVTTWFEEQRDLRLIIFTQYRETGQSIVEELSELTDIRPVLFVGQNRKGDSGMSQAEQRNVLASFREGTYNVLVSTSVGEEGLDIPKVDRVMFYEPLPSAIRTIQRAGRTGRFEKGKVTILLTEHSRDITTGYVATAKERKMYQSLSEIRRELTEQTKTRSLSDFLGQSSNSPKDEPVETPQQQRASDAPRVIVDSRENADLVKALYRLPLHVETRQLDVGDIVVSDHVVIERKSKRDFLSTLLEKRLFPQLMELVRNYRRPVLILEGEEDIFTLRNLNPSAIRATMTSIATDLRLPILYTSSIEETAQTILTMVQRSHRTRSDVSLSGEKRVLDKDQEMERFISTIPKVNVVTAKQLLASFPSIRDLVNAEEEDLLRCQGLGKKRAKMIRDFFTRSYGHEEE